MDVIFRAREESVVVVDAMVIVVVDANVDVVVGAVVVEVAVGVVTWVVEDTAVVGLAFPFNCGIEGTHPLNSNSEVINEARTIFLSL